MQWLRIGITKINQITTMEVFKDFQAMHRSMNIVLECKQRFVKILIKIKFGGVLIAHMCRFSSTLHVRIQIFLYVFTLRRYFDKR